VNDCSTDGLSDGWRFRILNVVDDFSRECLTATVDTSLSGVRVVRELERLSTARVPLRPRIPHRQSRDHGLGHCLKPCLSGARHSRPRAHKEGLLLSESQLAALEKAKTDKEAQGEFDSECPGYCGA
jgi:transposase InsO family protein